MILNCKKMIITALLLNAATGWADIVNQQAPQDFDGFYVGGLIGLNNITNKVQYMVNQGSEQLGQMGFIGGLYVGFDYNFSFTDIFTDHEVYIDPKMGKMGPVVAPMDFKIGVEGFGMGLGGMNSSVHNTSLPIVTCTSTGLATTVNYNAPSNTSLSVSSPFNAGIRILPAYQFQPGIFGHVILGWTYSNFTITDNGVNGTINSTFGKNGFQAGLGWQTAISTPFSWRLDMIYSYFGNQDSAGRGLAGSSSASQTYSQSLNSLEADISLVYKF